MRWRRETASRATQTASLCKFKRRALETRRNFRRHVLIYIALLRVTGRTVSESQSHTLKEVNALEKLEMGLPKLLNNSGKEFTFPGRYLFVFIPSSNTNRPISI